MMRIGLDFDGTYTRDPLLWDRFVGDALGQGHEVVIVTMRHETEPLPNLTILVIYTGRKSKVAHMARIGKPVDIWIDDMPQWLMLDAQ
jgi:hypothetical protein